MEKKELIRFIKNYFKEKGFNVSKRDFFGPLCVYERDDIYFIISISRSSYSDLQYFEYNYVINGLYDCDINEKGEYNYVLKLWKRITEFRPEEYTEEELKQKLDDIYEDLIEPIVKGGLDYICAQKDLIVSNESMYNKEALEYLLKYREEKGIECNTSEKYKNMYDKYTKKQKKKRTFFEWLKTKFQNIKR